MKIFLVFGIIIIFVLEYLFVFNDKNIRKFISSNHTYCVDSIFIHDTIYLEFTPILQHSKITNYGTHTPTSKACKLKSN